MQSNRPSYGRVKTSYSLRPETKLKLKELRRHLRMSGIVPISESDVLELLIMDASVARLRELITQLSKEQ